MRAPLLALCAVLSPLASAQEGTLAFKPDPDEERPVVKQASVRPQGSNFALTLQFDKTPWGEECRKRCANATLLLDSDGDARTGLQAGEGKPQTGADLGVTVQGQVDYGGESAAYFVKAKVRQLAEDDKRLDDGDVISDLDHRVDQARLELDGKEIRVLLDASRATLPAGKSCRLIYLAPLAKPVVATCRGMAAGAGSSSQPAVIRGEHRNKKVRAKAYEEQVKGR